MLVISCQERWSTVRRRNSLYIARQFSRVTGRPRQPPRTPWGVLGRPEEGVWSGEFGLTSGGIRRPNSPVSRSEDRRGSVGRKAGSKERTSPRAPEVWRTGGPGRVRLSPRPRAPGHSLSQSGVLGRGESDRGGAGAPGGRPGWDESQPGRWAVAAAPSGARSSIYGTTVIVPERPRETWSFPLKSLTQPSVIWIFVPTLYFAM